MARLVRMLLLAAGMVWVLGAGAPAEAQESCFCGDGNTPTLGCCGGDGQRPCVLSSWSLTSDCDSTCNPGHVQTDAISCAKPRGAGQSCGPAFPCREGHSCWPTTLTCVPNTGADAIPAEDCRDFHDPVVHDLLMRGLLPAPPGLVFIGSQQAVAYGVGDRVDAGASTTTESGIVYGGDGRFGCYVTQCQGYTTELSASLFGARTIYDSYDSVAGGSEVYGGGFGHLGLEFGVGLVLEDGTTCEDFVGGDLDALSGHPAVTGTTLSASVEFGVLPVDIGCYACNTTLTTVIGPSQPVAACSPILAESGEPRIVCAEPDTCLALLDASDFDAGSYDPDGTLVSREIFPAVPFPAVDDGQQGLVQALDNPVTLVVTDDDGLSDACTAFPWVADCQPPTISCPQPVTLECQGQVFFFGPDNEIGPMFPGAFHRPAPATASDNCSGLTGTDRAILTIDDLARLDGRRIGFNYPFGLGTTLLPYSAYDGFNTTACAGQNQVDPSDPVGNTQVVAGSSVTVRDTTPPQLFCPATRTATCEGAEGAPVAFGTPSAADVCVGTVTPSCDHASGSTFGVGTTEVTCHASDTSGNVGSCSFDVVVSDPAAPDVSCPASRTLECTGAAGATTTYAATATDACTAGALAASCERPSGSAFALGTETVTCSATDASGNVGSCGFDVEVVDTTQPMLALEGSVAPIECAVGSFVDPGARATDTCDTGLGDTLVPGVGTVDPSTVGDYVVSYDASDASGNAAAQATRTVSVVDTTPPEIACPADITVEPVSPAGTAVQFAAASWSDACDTALPTPTCALSGSTFGVGTQTEVGCEVADATSGPPALASSCTLQVRVLSLEELVAKLRGAAAALGAAGALNGGQTNALGRHLDAILRSLGRASGGSTCGQLAGWASQIDEFVADGVLTAVQAEPLLATARNLAAARGCASI